jgi:hypothetical protein
MKNKSHMYNFKDLTGMTFGKLHVIKESGSKHGTIVWLCKCDCGKTTKVIGNTLRDGRTKSCGCGIGESIRKRLEFPNNEGLFRSLYRARRSDSLRREIPFELSMEEFREIIHYNCEYCNIKPSQIYRVSSKTKIYLYNGIDRVDNSKGYRPSNCVACCGTCNTMKGQLSLLQFLKQIHKIAKNRRENDI